MVVYHFGRLLQVYDVDLVPLLLSTLLDLFNNYRIKQFLISATIRNSDTFVTFLKACGLDYFPYPFFPLSPFPFPTTLLTTSDVFSFFTPKAKTSFFDTFVIHRIESPPRA